MKIETKKEDAVSPVIGVMLMLVVTVVIAAVVVTFATGMTGDSTATTPMALFEVDTPLISGGILQSFDLIHKGGDQIALENLLLTLEPIGGPQSGIILERTGSPAEENTNYNSDYSTIRDVWLPVIEQLQWVEGQDYTLETSEGIGQALSVRGKTGEDVVVSTGDRIKVGVKLRSGGVHLHVFAHPELGVADQILEATQYNHGEDSSMSDMPSGITVRWTLSDIRTTGVIAKGEFVVPEK